MSIFRWGEGTPGPRTSRHEKAHHRACKALGHSGYWEHGDNGESYWVSEVDDERDAAVIEAAGYLTGGGDSANDERAARKFAKAAKVPLSEVEREARKYAG